MSTTDEGSQPQGANGLAARLEAWARAPSRRPFFRALRDGLIRLQPSHPRAVRIQQSVARSMGLGRMAQLAERRMLTGRAEAALREDALTGLLVAMAGFEAIMAPAPLEAGARIAELMTDGAGRARLQDAAQDARAAHPQSAYLTHIVTLAQALAGDHRGAGADLAERLSQPFDAQDPLSVRRFEILRDSWRVVDQAARENMDWIGGVSDYRQLIPAVAATEASATPALPLRFKEHLLQGRLRDDYLAACDADLEAAPNRSARLRVLLEMLRPSLRPIASYTQSYDFTRDRLLEHAAEWTDLLTREAAETEIEDDVTDILRLTQLSRKLGLTEWVERCVARLEALSQQARYLPALWTAPAEIAQGGPACDGRAAVLMERILAARRPDTSRDVRGYFHWATFAQDDDRAQRIFAALPDRLKRQNGALWHAQLLQRAGKLDDALAVLRGVHGDVMANPARMNAFTSRSLVKRVGELRFLIRTAEIMAEVPQPTAPKGIVLIAPRNMDHLRRYPLLALREMKRAGWAVIPLVRGLLPFEPTGRADIDILNGALTPQVRVAHHARDALPPLDDFDARPADGVLRWGDMDLSHPLWEDASINRRRHSVDWSCPTLQVALGNLASWTEAVGRCLTQARAAQAQHGLPVAAMSLFEARLPDCLFRHFCEKHGDPDTFFHLHVANGYQNYFTQFSTNVSEGCVLRNMTRHPEARSASFPLPSHFERFVASQADAPLPNPLAAPKAAQADPDVLARIDAWRAKGGRVACAFGKVVCDSAVPFDGGPAHSDLRDWINHCIEAVQGSDTLLLIKPHPHELNERIATFPTECFADLIDMPLGDNAVLLGHRDLNIEALRGRLDLGVVYNGTTCIELGAMGIPCLLAGHFAPIDYPIGHDVPRDRADFAAVLRGARAPRVAPDLERRAALWLRYMRREDFILPYRFHTRPVTNTVLYPPWWIEEDLKDFAEGRFDGPRRLALRAMGHLEEPS